MRMSRFGSVLAFSCLAWAQEPAPLAFEVASVKASPPDSGGTTFYRITSQYSVKGASLRDYVKLAWGLQDYAVDAPKWLDAAKFDVVGKLPEGAPHTQSAVNQMMQSLLVDQFQLTFHREKRDVNGYALVAGKNGLKLTRSTTAGGYGTSSGLASRVWAKGVPLTQLATQLSQVLNDPVVNQIPDESTYDYDLKWDSGDRPASTAGNDPVSSVTPAQTLAGALEQAGLRFEKRKIPLDVFIVDKMDKAPRQQ